VTCVSRGYNGRAKKKGRVGPSDDCCGGEDWVGGGSVSASKGDHVVWGGVGGGCGGGGGFVGGCRGGEIR